MRPPRRAITVCTVLAIVLGALRVSDHIGVRALIELSELP